MLFKKENSVQGFFFFPEEIYTSISWLQGNKLPPMVHSHSQEAQNLNLSYSSYGLSFLGSSAGEESACNAGDPDSIPGSGGSRGEGIGYPCLYSGLENPHGQRSLAGYSPWGAKSGTRLSGERTQHGRGPQLIFWPKRWAHLQSAFLHPDFPLLFI